MSYAETPAQVFLAALQATARGADRAAEKAGQPIHLWRQTAHLSHPLLRAISRGALDKARGPRIAGISPLHFTTWENVFQVDGGQSRAMTLPAFAEWLAELSKDVREKGHGKIACPITCQNGRRTNATTTTMHALNLDCDGRGRWEKGLAALDELDLAHVAYESGGSTGKAQKWHLVIPLSEPRDVRGDEKRSGWVRDYNAARAVLGSLFELLGEGFDPTCATPCQPVFLTERRLESDPPRGVRFRLGHSLDIRALAGGLPFTAAPPRASDVTATAAQMRPSSPERCRKIVDALLPVVRPILFGRRDLYLALPGTLLDKGVHPDDVLAVIEEVSLRCPGDPTYTDAEVASRHREHLHNALTTIAKWRSGGLYTRIGTLVEHWPEVARALDRALPHPLVEKERQILERWMIEKAKTSDKSLDKEAAAEVLVIKEMTNSILACSRRKLKSGDEKQWADGVLLRRFIEGEALLASDDPEPLVMPFEFALSRVAGILAFLFHAGTPLRRIVKIGFVALNKPGDFRGDAEGHFKAEYERAVARRVEKKEIERLERRKAWL